MAKRNSPDSQHEIPDHNSDSPSDADELAESTECEDWVEEEAMRLDREQEDRLWLSKIRDTIAVTSDCSKHPSTRDKDVQRAIDKFVAAACRRGERIYNRDLEDHI